MKEKQKISIVILLYYSKDYIKQCVKALYENTFSDIELIIINNACPQKSYKSVKNKADIFINNEKNYGFGFGCNQGVAAATNNLIVLLNADTVVLPNWDIPLLEALEDHNVGIAIPQYLNFDNTVQEAGSLLGLRGESIFFGEGKNIEDPEINFDRNVIYSSAAACMLRKNEFDNFGGFSNDFKIAYHEDTDLMLTYIKNGFQIRYCSNSKVKHIKSTVKSNENLSNLIVNSAIYNGLVLQEKWAQELSTLPSIAYTDIFPNSKFSARDGISNHNTLIFLDDIDAELKNEIEDLSKQLISFDPFARLTVVSNSQIEFSKCIENINSDVLQPILKERLGCLNLIIIDSSLANKELLDSINYYQPTTLKAVLGPNTGDFDQITLDNRLKEKEVVLANIDEQYPLNRNIYSIDFSWEKIPANILELLEPYGWVH